MKLRFVVDRMHDPLTLERWQFQAVATGAVSRDALMLYLAVQAVGREGREADLDAIGRTLGLDATRELARLVEAGWVLEARGGWRMQAPRVAGAVSLLKDEPAKASAEPVAASGTPTATQATTPGIGITTRPRRKKKTPAPPAADATGATPADPTASEDPPDPEVVALTRYVATIAGRLIEAYPHGTTDNGLRRPAPPKVVKEKLASILRPLEPEERDRLAAEIVHVAEAYARALPDVESRRYVPALVVWLNQRRWEEGPPQLAKGGSAIDRNRQRAARQDEVRAAEGYERAPTQVDPAALEEARRRREQAVREAHQAAAARKDAGHAG